YSRLSAAEQHRVFQPHAGRRVVLATNVAETSLTVPGVRYVVDPGTARISRWSKATKVQRLPIEPISQASANQRSGRCGRVAAGIAIRLYSEEDFLARPAFTEPEILRTNLASVILQMADARLGAIEDFPFVEPPDRSQVRDGVRLLRELGALEDDKPGQAGQRLTRTGRLLARLPVDPRLGRMLVEAGRRGVAWDVLPIVAALAIPDVRERPTEKQAEADALHRRFWADTAAAATQESRLQPASPGEAGAPRDASDIAAIWRLWDYLRQQRNELSGNAFRRMCRDEYLNFLRIREWQDLVSQLREVVGELDLDAAPANADADTRRARAKAPRTASGQTPDWDAVHTAVLAGLLSHVGLKDETGRQAQPPGRARARGRRPLAEYLGARGARFAIQPGSAAAKAEPPLVMAVELVETTRLWARTVAPVEPAWVEAVGEHLITRQYSEPRWSATGGQCVATERVSLLGVPIIADRTVSYQRIDPVVARQVFIQSALVEGQWRTRHHFFARNERVRAEAEELEERTRRRDIVVDDAAIFAFYDARVPDTVTTVAHFDRWWREKRRTDERYLDLRLDDLVADESAVDAHAFPDSWTVGPAHLPVSYVFEPGAGKDGVSVDVDVTILNQVDAAPFTWQVPGLRDELATELVRSLPKAVRTRFVPAPDWAHRALGWLSEHPEQTSQPFPEALATALTALSGHPVDPDLFNESVLPEHLSVRYVITDGRRELGAGKDFASLRKQFAPRLNKRLNAAASAMAHPGATRWEFGSLPHTT
ncbi:MAG: ATP-dependent RNA helicase HrpA, partial [Actinomycetes bacterium]